MNGPFPALRRGPGVFRVAVLLALLASAGSGAAAQTQSSFCKDFRFIYDQRFDRFVKLRGFREDSTTYLPTVTPPNAKYCKIGLSTVSNSADFTCTWRYDDQARAIEDARSLVNSIKACLGPGASVSPGYVSEPPPLFQDMVWDSQPRSSIRVNVREAEYAPTSQRFALSMKIQYGG